MQHHQRDSLTSADSFPTDPTGLPEASRPELLELADGDTLELRVGPVAKRLGDATVRMLGYNGSIPGSTVKVAEGSGIVVHVENHGDLDTTVHWHGLRLENRYDGVPHETQAPIPVGGEFSYRIQFPDPGLYWYHPHIREDYTQELGLYGNILVLPADPDYWPPADRDLILTLDDILIEDGKVAPFSSTETSYTAMGRFGNQLLVAGDPDLCLTLRAGEVVRLWLTNTANTRVFKMTLPGARMKLVGGDSGRVEYEEFVEQVVLAPSERVVVDVLVESPGELALEHHTPDRTYRLAVITVTDRGPVSDTVPSGSALRGAGPAASSPCSRLPSQTCAKRSPPMPVDIGSVTQRTAAAARAASTALPPRSSARRPARVASGWLVATMASAATAGGRKGEDHGQRRTPGEVTGRRRRARGEDAGCAPGAEQQNGCLDGQLRE